jgi:hypothetical protein
MQLPPPNHNRLLERHPHLRKALKLLGRKVELRARATRKEMAELAKAGSAIFVCARDVTANDPDLSVVLILVQEMQRWKHDRVQHANDQDLAVRGHSVEDGMLANQRAKVRRDLAKGPT